MDLSRLRNLSIVAHVDHGKSTLADRLLELCGAVDPRDMRAQYLDSMDIERERGITIKLQSVRLDYRDHVINLIDTPGHVDFGYEVSRSLAACEGVILLVDAAQGIEAQTLANCYLALENDLEIVACLNKLDLPAAEPDRCASEIEQVLGIAAEDILRISAKTGDGVPELLDAVIEHIPAPTGDPTDPLQALIYDSYYDSYRGVVSSVRVMTGTLKTGSRLRFMQAGAVHDADEIGVRRPDHTPVAALGPGETGYLIAGIKDVREARSGETVTDTARPATAPLEGYREPKPMVFCGLYPIDGDQFSDLRDALEKLRLNDGSYTYEPETSGALGFGFRCGFLGLLHMEIIRERLVREFNLDLIATAPSVAYLVHRTDGEVIEVANPSALPDMVNIEFIEEPMLTCTILTPKDYTGTIMELCQNRRGEMGKLEYLSPERVELIYKIPLAEVVRDFFDQLKSRTQGYASLDYDPAGYQRADLVKVDVLLNGVPADAFSNILHRDKAQDYGRRMSEKLKDLIPRQMFDVPIQAAIGGRIISRETVKAKRKDVLAKCYGGDITRKRKLLEKQKEGKKRMKNIGSVEVPQEAFISSAAARRLIVDLSHPFGHGTITYPGLPGPAISDHLSRADSRERYAPGVEFQIGRIEMVSNTGTYLDTPFHRYPDGHDLSGLDLSRVVDVPGVLVGGVEHGDLDVAGRAVLFHTGWDRHWGTDAYGDPSHPYLAAETAKRLVDAGAAVVGIDSVNIDSTVTGERPIHSALLAAGIPIVEHLTNLQALAGRAFRFTAAPPAVVGMGTFPVRAVAVLDDGG